MRALVVSCALGLWSACSAGASGGVGAGSPAPAHDAGAPDAGQAPRDAGAPAHDAGSLPEPPPVDAGTPHDAGSQPDATLPMDSGAPHDSGMPHDSGAPIDSGATSDAGSDAGPPLPAWTVLVYMAADNNLEKYAIDDLNEMLSAKLSSDVQVIAQIDRASGFYELGVGGVANWDTMRRFRVREKQLEQLADLGEQDTGDPQVLTDFIRWGLEKYPAQHQMLVLWDHGNAWQGYGGDDSADDDRLDQLELQQAINAGLAAHSALDVIGFDACLMSTFVTAGALREHAHYFIGSEELEPGNGWDYTDFYNYLSTHLDATGKEVGSAVVEGFYAQARVEKKHNDVTIATLDLTRYEPVLTAYTGLVTALAAVSEQQKTNIAKARAKVVEYGKHSDPVHAYNMVDLGDFSRQLAELEPSFAAQRDALLTSLSNLVVSSRFGRTKAGSTGSSVYFPTASAFYQNGYDAIQEGVEWRSFLKQLYALAEHPSSAAPSFVGQAASSDGAIGTQDVAGGSLASQPISAAPKCDPSKGPEASSALKPADVANVASATLVNGLIESRTGDVHVFSREPAQLDPGSGEVKGTWDRHVLVANQGATQVILFAEFEHSDDERFVFANVPVLYSQPPACPCAVPGTPGYSDVDLDGTPDCADPDVDADGVPDKGVGTLDNCKWVPNADQTDTDVDGVGDACSLDAHMPPLGCQPQAAGDFGSLQSAFWHVTVDRLNDERYASILYVTGSAGASEISPQPGALLWPRGLILRPGGNLGFQTGNPLPFNLQKPIDFRYADIEHLYVLNEAGDPLLDAQLQPQSLLAQLGWNDVYMRVFVSDFAHRGGAAEVRGDFSSCDPPPLEVCAAPKLPDCDARCLDPSELLPNGTCDDGSNGTPNLNCALRNFDDGECARPDCPAGYIRDCEGKCTLHGSALGDGHCDQLAKCESLQYDHGDCPCGPDCSGHGACAANGCSCETGYSGQYCEVTPSCGDGTCRQSDRETCKTCAADCGACPELCGDGTCSPKDGETCDTCAKDCGACACGDGKCSLDTESCSTCPQDCGACPTCGDFICQGHERGSAFGEAQGENCGNCPTDCGSCQGDCCVASGPSAAGAGGCADAAVSRCACDLNPSCCTAGWSAECIALAATSCNLVCLACPPVTGGDQDEDSICGKQDNCPLVANPDQADADRDGVGDACDVCAGGDDLRDPDRDGVPTHCDNCPLISNRSQLDADGDGVGDECDVCRTQANPLQQDTDGDRIGNACDNCPAASNADQSDLDGDGLGDACDACTDAASSPDTDGDGLQDHCDLDDDNDTLPDTSDNCPLFANPTQSNNDGDALGDACDPDDDNDGVTDGQDNCPLLANAGQANNDADALGDACDPDDDNDGVLDGQDNCPLQSNADQRNTDLAADGGDACDPDDDDDGVVDGQDNCPLRANDDQLDVDQDGVGDACDPSLPAHCSEIHSSHPSAPSGRYFIDPDGQAGALAPLSAQCDMTTDGGGWTLVLNYLHQLGTQPALRVRTQDLPLQSSAALGADEAGGVYWGHAAPALIAALGGNELRFQAQSSAHARSLHFSSIEPGCVAYAATGQGSCAGVATTFKALSGHTALLPAAATAFAGNAGDLALTALPFYDGAGQQWAIAANGGVDWSVDDAGAAADTHHRVWLRSSADLDGDGVPNAADNCPYLANAGQQDTDGTGGGDACDADDDGDGVLDAGDNCPLLANAGQQNTDGAADGGDACDPDDDDDGVLDAADNCPLVANAGQSDQDGDGAGDACDGDTDGDGVLDGVDNCPATSNPGQENTDGTGGGDACDPDDDDDGVLDVADNCRLLANADQADQDGDGVGDACDPDDDGDGVPDGADNCPLLANAGQLNTDGTGGGDACDPDDDDDGVPDVADNCALLANVGQSDQDLDGLGDACDTDADGDGVPDGVDNCLGLSNPGQENTDAAADGGDACDADDDDDGVPDNVDNCPLVSNADQVDLDQDNIGDACDGFVAPTCNGVSCSSHGTCSTDSGAAVCTCGSGWSGSDCSAPDCSGISCGTNGSCQIDGGVARCACSAGFGGPECDYKPVYALDVPVAPDWRVPANVPYSVDNSAVTTLFDRVAYRLQLDGGWVWVDAPAFTTQRSLLGVPTDWIWQQALTDMTVRSNVAGVVEVTHGSGNMEFWSDCYGQNPGATYDWEDSYGGGSDCYGSLQLFQQTQPLLAVNAWSGNHGVIDVGIGMCPGDNPDWTFERNADSFTTRKLEVFVHERSDCTGAPCGAHGSCVVSNSHALCACSLGWAGATCDRCDSGAGYADLDSNGTCVLPGCSGGACNSLPSARGLATGLHDFALSSGSAQLYVDGSYSGGGWLLVGRGREDWAWNNTGLGQPADLAAGLGTPAAFAPKYLAAADIQQLIAAGGGSDLSTLEMRIRRAADVGGTAYQEVLWTFPNSSQWTWDFPGASPSIHQVVASSALGGGSTSEGSARDISPSNDHTRVFTFPWDSHENKEGFSYGQQINLGSNDPSSFLWMSSGEGHAMPYAEVYLRLKACVGETCSAHGTCDGSTGAPVCICSMPYGGSHCETIPSETGTSCLDIHVSHPSVGSGWYMVDPDGAGPEVGVTRYCDMVADGGGWTTVALDDFESGSAPGWTGLTGASLASSVDGSCINSYTRFLGGPSYFGQDAFCQRTYSLSAIPHSEVRVTLDYLAIDSWDGESATVSLNGAPVYGASFRSGGPDVCGAGFGDPGRQSVSSQIASAGDSLTVYATSGLDQDSADESFGVDNVRIMVR